MLHNVFTIFDTKTGAHLPPFYSQTKASAIRAVSDTLNDPNHQFTKHPEDYVLFFLGSFEDEHAKFSLEDTPISLAVLIELIPMKD